MNGLLDHLDLHPTSELAFESFKRFLRVLEGLLVEVKQDEARFIADLVLNQKFLDFPGRSAPEVENLGVSPAARQSSTLLAEKPSQVIDAITMGFRGALAQEPGIDNLGKDRASFQGISEDHVDHFIVPSVPQRFVVGPVGEGRTEKLGVELPLGVGSVKRQQVNRDLAGNIFKFLEEGVDGGQNGRRQLVNNLKLESPAFARGGGANA